MEARGLSLCRGSVCALVFTIIVLNAQLSISLNAQKGSKNHAIKIKINPNCSQVRCHSNYRIEKEIRRFKRSPIASEIRVFKYVEYDSSKGGSNKSTSSITTLGSTTTKIPKISPPPDRSLIPNKFFGQTESESKVFVVNTAKPFDSVVDITEDREGPSKSKPNSIKNSQEISKRIETREPLFGPPPPPPPPRPPPLQGLIPPPPKLPSPQPYTSGSDFYEHEFDRDSKAAETMTGWIPRILKHGPRLRQRHQNQNQNGQLYSGSSRNPYYPTQRQSSSRHRLQKPLPRPSGSRYGNGNSKLRQRHRHQNQNQHQHHRQRKGQQNVKKYPQGPPRFASILRQRIRRPLNLNRSPLNPLNRGHAAQNQVPYTYPKNAANIQDIIHHFDRETNDLGPGQHGEASGMDDAGGLSKELQDVHTSLLKDIREFARRPILMNQAQGDRGGNKAEKSQSQNKPTKYRQSNSNQNPSRKQNHYTISRERDRDRDREVQENDHHEDPWEPQPKPVRDMVRTQSPPQDFQDGTSSEEEYHFQQQQQLARERDRDRDRDRELKFKKKRTRQRQREIEEELRREREWTKAKAKTRQQVYHNESPENYMDDSRNYHDRDMQPYPTSSSEEFVNSRPISKPKNRYQDPEPEDSDNMKYRGRERKKPYLTRSQNVPVVIKTPFRPPPVEHDDDGYDVATKRYYNTQEYYPPISPYDQGAEPAAPVVEIHTGPSFPPTSTPSFTHQSNSLHPHDKHWQRLYMEYLLSQQQPRRPSPTNNRIITTNKPMRMKIHIYPNGNGEPGPPQEHDTSRSASESNGQNYGQSSRILPPPPSNILDKPIYSTYPSPPGHYQNQNGIGTNIQIPPYPIRNSHSKVRPSGPTDRPVESKKVGGVVLHLHVHSNGENANRRSDTVSSHREHLYDDDEEHEIEGDMEANGSSIHQKTVPSPRDRYKYQNEQINEDDQDQSYEEQTPAQVDKTISMELPVKDGKINHVLSTLLNLREQN